jgi:tetratricopeptide (TPR) repeat protein
VPKGGVLFDGNDLDSGLGEVARYALAEWSPDAEVHLSPLAPGLSGAALLLADITSSASGDLAGVYVLKVESDDGRPRSGRSGEERVREVNEQFAEAHVPKVLRHWSGTTAKGASGSALLLEIAGGSLRRYTAPTRRGSDPLLTCVKQIAAGIAGAWTDPANVVTSSVRGVIEEVLGSPEKTEEALALADDYYDSSDMRYEHGHVFLSPSLLTRKPLEGRFVRAFQHGDLHTGNVILPIEPRGDADDFWLIDFDRSKNSFFGLDLAYLELSVICDFYDDLTNSSLAKCLDHVEFPERNHQVPDDLHWLAAMMRESRTAIAEFAATTAGRGDDLEKQMIVVRIAEALRWARRHARRRKSHLALVYAGWYAARLGRMLDEAFDSLQAGKEEPDIEQAGDGPLGETELKVWDGLWNEVGRFGRRDWTYVLVAERIGDDASLGALGNLPFSAVVDLDPSSDHDGLYRQAGPVLASSRAVHVFSERLPVADEKRGTFWLMSAGWRLRREAPVDFRQWLRSRLRNVRALFETLRQRTGDGRVCIVALAGKHQVNDAANGEDRLVRVLETADEVWEGKAALHVVGDTALRSVIPVAHHPIAARAFVRQLATVFGAEERTTEYQLPGRDSGETVVVQQEALQVLREYFEVLHHRIASDGVEDEQANDAFWRGGQILWGDLAEELDVARDVGPSLRQAILDSLESHRTHTVVLQHLPGAGGTTAALRAAWDVHRLFPVAVLRSVQAVDGQRVPVLADRLHRLFVLTERPVLLVADAADLSEANRELLYRELATRNARITLLYVRRSLSPSNRELAIENPLSEEEARLFLARFRQLTDDRSRLAELDLLSTPEYKQYRTPFFYGLITYQRDFTKVGEYVSHHIREVAGRARDVLAHLALVTVYSNSGLQLGLLQRLFRFSVGSDDLTVEDLLGSAAALVVQRGGRYRIAHQLLAEELLAWLAETKDWHLHLKDFALDFLDDVSSAADTSADPVRLLFRQVFIDRVSGVTEGIEDRGVFAPIIERLDAINPSIGHQVLEALTEAIPDDPHLWNHLGRHQIYRLRREFDKAERHLEQAISLSPEDPLHHHTLGLVRRARLRQGLRTAEGQGTEAVMAVVAAWFERTVECFERSRELMPDDIYGYITHVQTILDGARALRAAAQVETVAQLPAIAGEWVVEQFTIANSLLDDASQLYGTLERQDDYLQQCLADIRRLYGDLDAVVRLWEIDNAGGRATPFSRRALAQAYFVRAKRSWRALSELELERIASLAEENLRLSSARDEDYRLWFEAHKLLPDFDVEKALSHLELWSARLPSWRAAYYRYVLYFLLWFSERSEDLRAFESAQEACAKRVPGRVKHSHIWLGKDPRWCPLVADSDLGDWDRRKRFWEDASLLQRVNGVIDFLDGPASGQVAIGDSQVRAFFVPAAGGFMAHSDENAPVNFFIGFSPAGLRAWDVQRGHADDALTRRGEVVALPAFVSRPKQADYEKIQRDRVESLQVSRIRELVQAFTQAALSRMSTVELEWVRDRVMATAGVDSSDQLSDEGIRRMAMVLPDVRVDEQDGKVVFHKAGSPTRADTTQELEVGFVSNYNPLNGSGVITRDEGDSLRFYSSDLHPESQSTIQLKAVVRFLPSRERRVERALRIEVLPEDVSLVQGRIVEAADLPPLVQAEVRRILEERAAQSEGSIAADELEDRLHSRFHGGLPLSRRLDVDGLRTFLRQQEWLAVRGHSGDQVVELRETFGRAHGRRERGDDAQASKAKDIRTMVRTTVAELRSCHEEVTLQLLGPALKRALGSARYGKFGGKKRLKRALANLGEWELTEVRPGVTVIEPKSGDGSKQPAPGQPPKLDPNRARKLVVEIEETLKEEGKAAIPQVIGSRLRDMVGEDAYRAFVKKDGLVRTLKRLGL